MEHEDKDEEFLSGCYLRTGIEPSKRPDRVIARHLGYEFETWDAVRDAYAAGRLLFTKCRGLDVDGVKRWNIGRVTAERLKKLLDADRKD